MTRPLHTALGFLITVLVADPRRDRDEHGLSQSTENAVLLAGAVAVAGLVIAAITSFVQSRLPK